MFMSVHEDAAGHAISEEAKRFYVHHGFAESPVDAMTMMITLADVEKAMGISRDPRSARLVTTDHGM